MKRKKTKLSEATLPTHFFQISQAKPLYKRGHPATLSRNHSQPASGLSLTPQLPEWELSGTVHLPSTVLGS